MSSKEVIVLGAGVIGLQTAVTLLEAGYGVTVLAEYLPGDEHGHYTSPWAGAIWRTHAPAGDTEVCAWDAETYRHWKHLVAQEAKEGREGESGIKMLPATQYWDVVTDEITDGISSIWWAPVVDGARVIPAADLPAGVHYGLTYRTFAVNVPRYLSWLVSRIRSLGGRVHRFAARRDLGLAGAVEAAAAEARARFGVRGDGDVLATVNATGLAARWLVPDEDVHVVQGQTVSVRGEAQSHVARLGADILDVVVVIPRPGSGSTVIGSSRLPGSWDTRPSGEVSRRLLEGAKKLVPELLDGKGEFDVIGPNVGLRPYRKGGPRVEMETLPQGQVVVHAYGHAGAGYQNSIGSARKVLRLLEERRSSKL